MDQLTHSQLASVTLDSGANRGAAGRLQIDSALANFKTDSQPF
jgi:hypothetical protein